MDKLLKDKIENFITSYNHAQFLQSTEWGDFQQSEGRKVFNLFAENTSALIIENNLYKNLSYLYCPRGPIGKINEKFLDEIIGLAKKQKSIFFRFEPQNEEQLSLFKKNFLVKKTLPIQPKTTLISDIIQNEDEILSKMHAKTRYNIRLAEKKDVVIEKFSGSDKNIALDNFIALLSQTSSRDNFGLHPASYYKKLLANIPFVKLYMAKYQDQYIAGILLTFFGDTCTYLHGASSNEHRNVMSPYLLQWTAIKDAKLANLKYYDFWGIAPNDDPKHPWAGITRFKKGFGGEVINYPGTYDLVLNKFWYSLYALIRKVRRTI
jgi:peptidoglycan pentaglycine glycine transferase (the first glycine)